MQFKKIASVFLAVTIAITMLPAVAFADAQSPLEAKLSLLRERVMRTKAARNTVFLSASDKKNAAFVVTGNGASLAEAFDNAAGQLGNRAAEQRMEPVWLKADVVIETQKADASSLSRLIDKSNFAFYFRKGIAFDPQFGTALLEQELNANSLIDYEANKLDLPRLGAYLAASGKAGLARVTDELTLFSCQGYFLDEDNTIYELNTNEASYGRRKNRADYDTTGAVIKDAAHFLVEQMQPDGRFIYGYYPLTGEVLPGYNIVRHEGTIWVLALAYKLTHDESLVPAIDKAVAHLLGTSIVYNGERAYVSGKGEISMGGNGLGVVALTEYMQAFGTDKYLGIAKRLGDGILGQIDPKTGQLTQVLTYPGFKVKHVFLSEFYDGEAALALAKLYGFTGEQKYLDGARKLCDYFINNDYEKYASHWMAYCFNEITKYDDNPLYYEFAMRNVSGHLLKARDLRINNHTYFEFFMAGFEQYNRMREEKITTQSQLDGKVFANAIINKADQHLNAFTYPEFAMYMKYPSVMLSSFNVRSDAFRTRIDDVQHFMGGYCLYYANYDAVRQYAGVR